MSLADELLADLEEIGDEPDDDERNQNDADIAEAMEEIEDISEEQLTVKSIARLSDSEKLVTMMKKINRYMENPRDSSALIGSVEADPEYQLIVDSNNLTVEIDNEIIVIHKFVRDMYSKRFPELESLIHTPIEYIKTVQLLRNDLEVTKVDLSEIVPAATIMVVSVTASTTQGQEIEERELAQVLEACDMALDLNEKKLKIMEYVESRMSFIAPNLSQIVGPTVAAKLMGVAGGLSALSKIPACNIQVLGAQKKTLAGFSTATVLPHSGFIFYTDIVQNAPLDIRKKVARLIACKCTLAARVDSFHECPGGEIGEQLREEVQKKVDKLMEPPPVKAPKPLPKPDDAPRKKRGGRRQV